MKFIARIGISQKARRVSHKAHLSHEAREDSFLDARQQEPED